ncbi:MAG: TetR/AcrR family transcriptional regulator [Deltaproteobacteria bacterium]|nr:TetR/AcrR family transcriptional regulator [Deltaproteobacteria bacterium]
MAHDRDLNRTRESIVAAASMEFARKGFAGARTDAIARRAGVNERMIFYCFDNKEGVYREILRRKLSEKMRLLDTGPENDFAASLVNGFEMCAGDVDLLRMVQWEELQGGTELWTASEEHQTLQRAAAAQLRRLKARGALPHDTDEQMLQLVAVALKTLPFLLPQLTRQVSGHDPKDPRFRRRWVKCLRWLGERIGNAGVKRDGAAQERDRQVASHGH